MRSSTVDVDAALLEAREPLALDVQRPLEGLRERAERRVEALQMAHREEHALRARGAEERIGFLKSPRDGLLHQHVHARIEKRQRDPMVLLGRHRDAHQVHCTEQRARIRVRRAAVLRCDMPGARRIRIGHPNQLYVLQRGQLLGVELSEIADAHHRSAQFLPAHGRIVVSRTPLRRAAGS
jgi:hypothetical protein